MSTYLIKNFNFLSKYVTFVYNKNDKKVNLANFFTCWKNHKDWQGNDMRNTILRHIVKWIKSTVKHKDELVILKIPTSNLDTEKFFLRSINRLGKFLNSNKKFNDIPYSLQEHLSGKTPAYEAPLFKMRKEAIEFIYKDDIPVENIERIGNIVNMPLLRKNIMSDDNSVNYIMENLLFGTNEVKNLTVRKP